MQVLDYQKLSDEINVVEKFTKALLWSFEPLLFIFKQNGVSLVSVTSRLIV